MPAILKGLPADAQSDPNTLRVTMQEAVPNIDPYANSQRAGLVIAHHAWDTLVYRDPQTFEPRPLLATSWTWTSPTTIELKLRPGVTFHNGDPFSADDVVYTVETVAGPNARVAVPANVNWMRKAEKVDDLTVRIETKEPFPAALEYLALTVPILPKGYREKLGPDAYSRNPVGCGPYRIARVEPGAAVEFSRFENYYADSPKGRPSIANIQLRFVPDQVTDMTGLMAGTSDWIWKFSSDQFGNLSRVSRLKTLRSPSMRINYLSLDAAGRSGAGNPLTDVRVRRAIFHAIDRRTMATKLAGEGSLVPNAPCAPSQFGCDEASAVSYAYDPAKAKALLAEAGFPSGLDATFVTYLDASIASALQGYLAAAGIRADIQRLQPAAAIKKAWAGEAPLYAGSWGSYSVNDVSAILPVMFGGGNEDYSRDPVLQKLIQEGGATLDRDQRLTAYKAAIKRATEQAYWLPLFTQVINYAFSKRLSFTAQADELPRFWLARWD
jgi:peptide/nickel transport system substrate-binding protein